MTNDERNPKPECRKTLSCAVAGFVIRISSFGFENCSLFNQKARQRTGEGGRGWVGSWKASIRFFAGIGAMNLEQVRLGRQRVAGILPAELFSDLSAGKMPAAPLGSKSFGVRASQCKAARIPPRTAAATTMLMPT